MTAPKDYPEGRAQVLMSATLFEAMVYQITPNAVIEWGEPQEVTTTILTPTVRVTLPLASKAIDIAPPSPGGKAS